MNKQQYIESIQRYFLNKPVLKAYLFGSILESSFTNESDIDILVELDYNQGGADFYNYLQMQDELCILTKRKIDLVSSNGISNYIRPIIDHKKNLCMNEKDKARILHIKDAIEFIQGNKKISMEETLLNDLVLRFAMERQLEIIGEAANFLSDELKIKYDEIEWRRITQFRNFLVNEYFGVDYKIIWDILENKIPLLDKTILQIINENKF